MYLKLSATTMADLTSIRGGMSVAIKAQVWDQYHGYMNVVETEEVIDTIITKVKELCDESKESNNES